MASEYDSDSKRVEVSGAGYTRLGVDVGRDGDHVLFGYGLSVRKPSYQRSYSSGETFNTVMRLVLDADSHPAMGQDSRLMTVLTDALGGNKIQCHCLALGYTKEQCKNKECRCDWCGPLATWLFCEELIITEEPG
jgi:hypothetical protein